MVPICTPSIFELGFPCAKAVAKKSLPPSTVAAGRLASVSVPNSRLLSINGSLSSRPQHSNRQPGEVGCGGCPRPLLSYCPTSYSLNLCIDQLTGGSAVAVCVIRTYFARTGAKAITVDCPFPSPW